MTQSLGIRFDLLEIQLPQYPFSPHPWQLSDGYLESFIIFRVWRYKIPSHVFQPRILSMHSIPQLREGWESTPPTSFLHRRYLKIPICKMRRQEWGILERMKYSTRRRRHIHSLRWNKAKKNWERSWRVEEKRRVAKVWREIWGGANKWGWGNATCKVKRGGEPHFLPGGVNKVDIAISHDPFLRRNSLSRDFWHSSIPFLKSLS